MSQSRQYPSSFGGSLLIFKIRDFKGIIEVTDKPIRYSAGLGTTDRQAFRYLC